MKEYTKVLVSVFLLAIFLSGLSYSAENDKGTKHYPPPEEYAKPGRNDQPNRPILPPSIPSTSAGVSPTPSPHIAAPPIAPTTIHTGPMTTFTPQTQIPNLPSSPAQAPMPAMPFQTQLPQVPIIANTIGKVLSTGSDKDGTLWLEVQDQLFAEAIKVKVRNLNNTPIVKQGAIMKFSDIKIGDTVNVIFSTEGDNNIVNFISIMSDEELELMWGAGSQEAETSGEGPTVAPESVKTESE